MTEEGLKSVLTVRHSANESEKSGANPVPICSFEHQHELLSA